MEKNPQMSFDQILAKLSYHQNDFIGNKEKQQVCHHIQKIVQTDSEYQNSTGYKIEMEQKPI